MSSEEREFSTRGYSPSRRRFLELISYLLGAIAAGLVAIPIVGAYLSPLLATPPGQWRRVGKVSDFPVGNFVPVGGGHLDPTHGIDEVGVERTRQLAGQPADREAVAVVRRDGQAGRLAAPRPQRPFHGPHHLLPAPGLPGPVGAGLPVVLLPLPWRGVLRQWRGRRGPAGAGLAALSNARA